MENNFDGLKSNGDWWLKTIRRTAETLLQKAGCEVVTAIDGFDVLAKLSITTQTLFCRHYDAAFGWLPDLCADKK